MTGRAPGTWSLENHGFESSSEICHHLTSRGSLSSAIQLSTTVTGLLYHRAVQTKQDRGIERNEDSGLFYL